MSWKSLFPNPVTWATGGTVSPKQPDIKLQLLRYSSESDYTLGLLFDDTGSRRFLCYTLEDESRTIKVYAETRISAGIYPILLKTVGGFHDRYSNKFGDRHHGMLWLQNVLNFTDVLMHIGNDDEDTAGCILLGATAQPAFIGKSTDAYLSVYNHVAPTLLEGGTAVIEIIDYDIPIVM